MTIGTNIKRLRQNKGVERLKEVADIDVTAVVVIADLTDDEARAQGLGAQMLEEKYGAKVYSTITEKDVTKVLCK